MNVAKLAIITSVLVLGCLRVVESQRDAVVSLLLNLAGFGTKSTNSPHGGKCPPITINKSSRLFYVENTANDFTPGKPRHLREVSPNYDANQPEEQRHLVTKRSNNVRPVTVDKYLAAYVYDSPTDGASGHRCGNFCSDDESCGFRRKCCQTPCGYACYQAVYNVTANLKP